MEDFMSIVRNSPAASVLALIVACAFAFVMVGCKTTPTGQQTMVARVAVSYATAKYIEKAGSVPGQQARAVRVIAVLDQVDKLAALDETTVDALRAYVAQRLPADLSPADRILAGTLIDVASEELKARIGEGVISPDAKLKVAEVLKWVREGATGYLPPTAST